VRLAGQGKLQNGAETEVYKQTPRPSN